MPAGAEFAEQRDEVRIGPVIEDNKPGVYRVALTRPIDIDGGGVAAEIVVGFVDHHVMLALRMPRDREAGNTAANDGNASHVSCCA